ncbi:hypothetical protein [Opitutus terrae]|uniref:Uncharacterized protein n=1 Tax=Opitutus terrae (strain DSM 11246 / JCM 15787 / PB90-1) TaxID=452637 RepID=B1ZMX4_OPITP|nr:hypothetical protein [Opitutus terrae]ACB75402.1 hypothetical protein Oter_2119 [Opitutus terrae PB90-1]
MRFTIRISIAANLVLLGIVALLIWRDRPAASAASGLAARRLPAAVSPAVRAPLGSETRSESVRGGAKLTRAAIAELEQRGIARDTLVNVVLEEFNRRSTQRLAALQRRYAPRLVPDREIREWSRALEAERIRELQAAFGEDGYRAWDEAQTLRELNRARPPGDELAMTADEAEQAYRLQKEFEDKSRELQILMEDGAADRADVGTLQAQAQQTLDRGLEQLLGKQRLDELRGTTDPTTAVYREFGDLNPTAGQAAAVVQTEAAYREREAALARQLTGNPPEAAKLAAELAASNAAREEDLRRIFGAEAYDNLKRQNDPAYQTLKQYAEAWELKDQEVESVYTNLAAFLDQAARTRSAAEMSETAGQRVNWREIDATIEQARQQTEAGLANLIGPERLRRLKQNGLLTTR